MKDDERIENIKSVQRCLDLLFGLLILTVMSFLVAASG